MAYNYVNSRIILDRLLSNPLLSDLTLEDLISHTVDFLRIVGIPDFFEEKNEEFKDIDDQKLEKAIKKAGKKEERKLIEYLLRQGFKLDRIFNKLKEMKENE